jgi:hypothetical protein
MAFVQKFMNATGKLRAVFGPANRSSIDHDMTTANRELLAKSVKRRHSNGRPFAAPMAAPT